MTDKERMARETLLRTAHSIIGESITSESPRADDDAMAEYHEERLIQHAREFVKATHRREVPSL